MKKISPAPPVLDEKPRELVDSNQHAVNNANQQVAPIPISPDALGALLIKIVSQQDSQQAQLDALGKTQHDLLLAIGRIEHGTLRKLSSEMDSQEDLLLAQQQKLDELGEAQQKMLTVFGCRSSSEVRSPDAASSTDVE